MGSTVRARGALGLGLNFDAMCLVGVDFGFALAIRGFGFFEDVYEVLALAKMLDGVGVEAIDELDPYCRHRFVRLVVDRDALAHKTWTCHFGGVEKCSWVVLSAWRVATGDFRLLISLVSILGFNGSLQTKMARPRDALSSGQSE